MTIAEINNNFQKTIATWERAMDDYTDAEFARRPAENSWSIGQVCRHIISSADNFAFVNIEQCLSGNENEQGQKKEIGVKVFAANDLPNVQIKGVGTTENTKQPESRQAVKSEFEMAGKRFSEIAAKVEKSAVTGKVAHYAFGFLDAKEWLQYTDIHFRHHLHQKERIDTFLKS